MFYFDGKRWQMFEKKITYTKTVTEYDNDSARFPDNAVIEDVSLTEEQWIRYDAMKGQTMIGVKELTEYVKDGAIQSEAVEKVDKADRSRRAILASLDLTTIDPQFIVDSGLARGWQRDSFFPQGDIINYGQLYKSKSPHKAEVTPDQDPEMEVI